MDKTNAMRMLESQGIKYEVRFYDAELTDGVSVAEALGLDSGKVFKTLVTTAQNKRCYVFMIPVATTLNLKKAARVVGEKSIEMLKQKELLPLTGYVHGGCSPVGMKKTFKTVIDESAQIYDRIIFSAGKRGMQVEVDYCDFAAKFGIIACDITM